MLSACWLRSHALIPSAVLPLVVIDAILRTAQERADILGIPTNLPHLTTSGFLRTRESSDVGHSGAANLLYWISIRYVRQARNRDYHRTRSATCNCRGALAEKTRPKVAGSSAKCSGELKCARLNRLKD